MAFDFDALNLINNCDEQTQIFTDEVRDVVQGALTGQIFQNPVDSLIQGSKLLIESNSGLSSTIGSALETAGGGVPGGPDLTQARTAIENLTQILTGDPTNPDSASFASVVAAAQLDKVAEFQSTIIQQKPNILIQNKLILDQEIQHISGMADRKYDNMAASIFAIEREVK